MDKGDFHWLPKGWSWRGECARRRFFIVDVRCGHDAAQAADD
jgi:hypothetical protein